MRINLKVKFEEKDVAKALGARWDHARKTWYIVDVEDLTPFMRWMSESHHDFMLALPGRYVETAAATKPSRPMSSPPVTTSATDLSLPDCLCDIPPWEHCEHTEPRIGALEREHIQSIAVG